MSRARAIKSRMMLLPQYLLVRAPKMQILSVNNQASSVVAGDVVQEGLVDIVNDAVQDEVWLTPPVPYTGQIFGTIKVARGFYNSYAQGLGFLSVQALHAYHD